MPVSRSKARGALPRPTLPRAEIRALRFLLQEGIERETFLMPRAIADSVCAEASRFLDEEFPARYADWLVLKTHRCYSAHRHLYKLMQARGNVARDRLHMFMRHWLASFLHLERPDLFYCLPVTFGDDRRLPPGTHPRIRRNGGCYAPPPNPRDWNEQRVYRHFRWTWLRTAIA